MSQSVSEVEIGGRTFQIGQLGGMRACRLAPRLLRLFGPALTKAMGGADSKVDLANINVGALADAVTLLATNLTEAETESLIRELLSTTRVRDGGNWLELMPSFDVQMQGRFMDVVKLCIAAAKVHLGSFFADLREESSRLIQSQRSDSRG